MNIRPTLLLAFIITFTAFQVQSQIANRIYSDQTSIEQGKKRTLIVEVLDKSTQSYIALAGRKKTEPSELEEMLKGFEAYNTAMKVAIEKYWKFHPHDRIQFKSSEEVKKIKSIEYMVLSYEELGDISSVGSSNRFNYIVPALMYYKAEKGSKLREYIGYLPLIGRSEDDYYSVTDLGFTLTTIQNAMSTFDKKGKPEMYHKYVKQVTDGNCSKLKGKNVLVDRDLLFKKTTEQEVKDTYEGSVQFIDSKEYNAIATTSSDADALLICVPYGAMESGGSSIGPISVESSKLISIKMLVNPKDFTIYTYYGIAKMGVIASIDAREADFKAFNKCLE